MSHNASISNNTVPTTENASQKTFLQAIFGEGEGYIEFRSFPPGGNGKPRQSFLPLPIKKLPTFSKDRDQYFGPAPRTQKRGTDKDVKETRCLWADVDAKCFEGGKEEAYQAVNDLGPLTPSIIVDTGNGFHAYWLLEEPMHAAEARDWMESLRFAISPKLDNVSNPSRILRIPGTQNLKNNDPKPVRIIDFEPDRLFNSETFEQYTTKPTKQKQQIPQTQLDDIDPVTMALEGTIPEGGQGTPFDGRNDAAAKVAGHFLSKNNEDRAFSLLKDWNQLHCDPPLEDQEIESVFNSISKKERAKDDGGLPEELKVALADCTDAGNAELLAYHYGDKLRYDHLRDRWLVWNGHWWAVDPDGIPQRMCLKMAKYRASMAFDHFNDSKAKQVFKWAVNSKQNHRVTSALCLAKITKPIADAGKDWDNKKDKIGVMNGVVNLKTGKLEAGKQEDRITRHLEINFDPGAKCPRFKRFLDEVFCGRSELIEHLQRALGYSLTGHTTEQGFWIMHGTGSNGKTVFLETLQKVFGEYGYAASFSTFEQKRKGYEGGHSDDLAKLEGYRFVTAIEVKEQAKINESRIKGIAGGDTQNARPIRGETREFEPECKIWLAVNHLPKVEDDTLGFWRKVRVIPFDQTFKAKADCEQGDKVRDDTLRYKLEAELEGILAWIVEGAFKWYSKGMVYPKIVKELTEKYRGESDPVKNFIEDKCWIGENAFIPSGDLYKIYRAWADEEGIPERDWLSHTSFARRIGNRFEKKSKKIDGTTKRCYIGINATGGVDLT